MKTSKEDILSRLSAIFDEGELTEEKVKIVEDISDTFDELSRASGDVEEVERKWRKGISKDLEAQRLMTRVKKLRKPKRLKLMIYLKKEVTNNGKCSAACNTH